MSLRMTAGCQAQRQGAGLALRKHDRYQLGIFLSVTLA